MTALLLVAPLLAFLTLTFFVPLARIIQLSAYDPSIQQGLPKVAAALEGWPGDGLPPDDAYAALAADLTDAKQLETVGTIANRLNVEIAGMRSVVTRTARPIGTRDMSAPRTASARTSIRHGRTRRPGALWRASVGR